MVVFILLIVVIQQSVVVYVGIQKKTQKPLYESTPAQLAKQTQKLMLLFGVNTL